MTMADVEIGDEVLAFNTKTGSLEFSPVIGFLHLEPERLQQFYRIFIQVKAQQQQQQEEVVLTVSGDHVLFAAKPSSTSSPDDMPTSWKDFVDTLARDVVRGTWMQVVTEGQQIVWGKVTRVDNVDRVGVYSPLTMLSTIVVDGVVSSCFSLAKHHVADTWFAPVRGTYSVFPAMAESISAETDGMTWHGYALFSNVLSWFVPESLWQV